MPSSAVRAPRAVRRAPAATLGDHRYTPTDHAVWRVLFERRMATLAATASHRFLDGLRAIGLSAARLPQLDALNARLAPRTGWNAVPTPGFMPARDFFASLARRRFPTVRTLRDVHHLDYVEAPDIFHDVFGHVPLHADLRFAAFLQRVGALGAHVRSGPEGDPRITELARLFWFTIEFGLVAEGGTVKVYGSGLISSHADAANALSPACERRAFGLDAVLAQPFVTDRVQDVLFVVEDFAELEAAVATLERRWR